VPGTGDPRLAVLIDAENITANFSRVLMDELAGFGTLTVRRAYGDWTSRRLVGWSYLLERHAIQPVQRFAGSTGGTATLSAMVIDAVDLLHAGNHEAFAIVCNDGSFTPLVTRLREEGVTVIGAGRADAADAFVRACDRFVDLDVLSPEVPGYHGRHRAPDHGQDSW